MKKLISALVLTSLPAATMAVTVNGFEATAYGFLKASSMYSTQGLASYNNINMSAPTNAMGRLSTRPQDKTSRMSFQTQQTRMGVNLKKGDNLTAKFEFDFIDFNKSSPTTQMNPRVRIASVTYVNGNHKMIIGQDWDLFSPVTSYTFDYVGLYFLAGNVGFMRQQAQYLYSAGEWELGGALGMAGNNPGVVDGNLETSKSPTYALRATRKIGPKGRVGVSGIYSRLTYNQPTENGTTHDSYAGNAFFENVWERFELKSEAYYGQNLANIGALSIGRGTQTSNVKEYGATLTGYYRIIDRNSLFGGLGVARIDNSGRLQPLTVGTATANVIANPGIRSNFLARVGWEFKVTEDLSWMTEVSRYETKSKIADNRYQGNIAYGLETGVQLRF
jgi:hypothetical protein